MKFRGKRREKVDITLISLIDVLFVLLLFFMVTTTFNRHSEVKIKLPEAQGEEPEKSGKPKQTLSVDIDKEGNYYVTGPDNQTRKLQDSQRETLARELSRYADQASQQPLIINADGETHHKAVVTVMDIATELGFGGIAIATEKPQGQNE